MHGGLVSPLVEGVDCRPGSREGYPSGCGIGDGEGGAQQMSAEARQGGLGLALAAGTQDGDLRGEQAGRFLLIAEQGGGGAEGAGFASRGGGAQEATADQAELAAGVGAALGESGNSFDVRREEGHDDPARSLGEDMGEGLPGDLLGAGASGARPGDGVPS